MPASSSDLRCGKAAAGSIVTRHMIHSSYNKVFTSWRNGEACPGLLCNHNMLSYQTDHITSQIFKFLPMFQV